VDRILYLQKIKLGSFLSSKVCEITVGCQFIAPLDSDVTHFYRTGLTKSQDLVVITIQAN